MVEAALGVVFVIAALGLLLFLWGKKKQVSLTRVSLPFAEFSVSSFDGLPPVMMFSELSMLCIPADPTMSKSLDGGAAANTSPTMMVHSGWNIVCEAFIARFGAYPTDEEVLKAAAAIGGQNVEFVQMFRGIYEAAIRHAASIDREFAANFLVRAPALAERIQGGARVELPTDAKFMSMMVSAESIVSGFDPNSSAKAARELPTAQTAEQALSEAQRQKLTEVATDEDWVGAWDAIAIELEAMDLVSKIKGLQGQELATPTVLGSEVYRLIHARSEQSN